MTRHHNDATCKSGRQAGGQAKVEVKSRGPDDLLLQVMGEHQVFAEEKKREKWDIVPSQRGADWLA